MEEEYPVQPMAHAATEQPLLRQATPPLPILQSSTPGFATPPPVTTVEGTSSSTPPTRLVMADISNINIKAVHAQAKRRGWERRRRAAGVAVAFEAAAAAAQEAQHAQRQLHLVAQQPGEGVAQWHWHLAVAPVPRQGATMASPAPGAPATIASVPLRLAEKGPHAVRGQLSVGPHGWLDASHVLGLEAGAAEAPAEARRLSIDSCGGSCCPPPAPAVAAPTTGAPAPAPLPPATPAALLLMHAPLRQAPAPPATSFKAAPRAWPHM